MLQTRLRVLLVDDELSLREPLTRYLKTRFEFEVDSAANYKEAMDLVENKQGQYDVALIDQLLIPSPDGIQLMRDIKSRYSEIECIIATGWGTEDRQIALQEGAFRYIEKPFDHEELAALIRAAAQQVRLRAIAQNVLSKRDLDEVLHQITDAVRSLVQADEAEIQLLFESTDTLGSYGRSEASLKDSDRKNDAIEQLTRQIIRSGKTEVFPDLSKVAILPDLIEQGFQSLVCVPIPGERGSLGSLCAYSRKLGQFEKGSDIVVLQSLARQTGLAIANARAFEETRTHARYMETLVNATGQLTKTTNSEEQLQLAWDFVCKQLETPTFIVALLDKKSDRLHFPILYDKNVRRDIEPMGFEEAARKTIIGNVIRTGQVFFSPTSHEREQKCIARDITSKRLGDPCETCLYVPLVVANEILGAVSVQAYEPHAFSPAFLDACRALANHLAIAIANTRLLEETQSRAKLLATLDESSRHIRAEKDPERLMHEIVRLAAELINCKSGCLLKYESYRKELEITVVHQMPEEMQHKRMLHDDGTAGLAARTGERQIYYRENGSPIEDPVFDRLHFNFNIAIPLQVSGEVSAVLFLADTKPDYTLDTTHLEALDRFANQAAIALHTSQSLTAEQRAIDQQKILLKVSDYIQASNNLDKILHVVLTGVTAGYGLGFNRACLLLLDDESQQLVGRLGIGHYDEENVRADWLVDQRHNLDDFTRYIKRLENDELKLTPIGEAMCDLVLPAAANDIFVRVMIERSYKLIGVDEEHKLADEFNDVFKPEFPLIVVPLVVQKKAIGLLIADNKFTKAPITEEIIRSLLAYANTAAIAIENRRLYDDSQHRLSQVEQTRKAASVVARAVVQRELHQVLDEIADSTRLITDADAAALYAYEETVDQFIEWGHSIHEQKSSKSMIGPKGLNRNTSSAYKLLDLTEKPYYRVAENDVINDKVLGGWFVEAEGMQAAIGIQLRASERKVGVMFVNFRSPHKFKKDDISTIQLFADQAAAAIYNRQLYDEVNRRATVSEVLYRAGQAIAASQTLQEMLEQVAVEALKLVRSGESNDGYESHIAVKFGDRIVFAAASSPEIMRRLKKEKPVINLKTESIIGIVGRVAVSGQAEVLGNVRQDAGYLPFTAQTRSELVVPMSLKGQVIGVINVEASHENAFGNEDLKALELLAAHAAVAIQTARLNEQTRLVAEIGREANALELQPILDGLFSHLATLFGERNIPIYLNLGILDKENTALELIPTQYYPTEILTKVQPIDGKGIMVWVARHGQPYYAPDVDRDENYNLLLSDTRSEYAIPVFYDSKLLGVLDLESPVFDAFSEDDQRFLKTIANQIASTLHNVQQYEEIKRVRGLVGTRTALAWMGMISNVYRHEMNSSAATIRERLALLRDDLETNRTTEVTSHLEVMGRVARRIQEIPLAPPLSSEEGVHRFPLCELVRQRLEQLSGREYFEKIEFTIDCQNVESSMVYASPEWIKRLVDLLCYNAADAMAMVVTKRLVVTISHDENRLIVTMKDTGKGIPDQVQKILFKEPVPKQEGQKGLGIGLLMAQLIIETYDGGIELEFSDDNGTIICFWLPVELKIG